MMAVGVLLFAIVQTAAMVSTMREHLRAGAATTSTMLVLVGAVATAVGIVLGRLSRCTLVYVDRMAHPAEVRAEAENSTVDGDAPADAANSAGVVSMPNPRVYQLGIQEGLRRARRSDDPS